MPRLILLSILALALALAGCHTPYQATGSQAQLHGIDKSTPVDSNTLSYIAPYKRQMDKLMQDTLGYSERLLDKDRPDRSNPQSYLGNFMVDLLLVHGRNTLDKKLDIGLANAGGLRTTLPQGAITLGKVYEIMPFDNTIVILQITGTQVDSLAQMIVSGKDAIYSGMRIVVNAEGKAEVYVGATPLQMNQTYSLITSDYLAGGGSNMSFLRGSKILNNTGVFIRDFMAEYIRTEHKASRRINAALDQRFTRKP